MSLGANLRYEKLLRLSLADDTATFLFEGVLLLWNAFDEGVLIHSSLNVVLDFLAAFRCLKWSDKGVKTVSFRNLFQAVPALCIITFKQVDDYYFLLVKDKTSENFFHSLVHSEAIKTRKQLTNHLSSFTSVLSWVTSIKALSLSVRSSTLMTGILCQKKETFSILKNKSSPPHDR